ncbi:SCP2 sterol-binding domain-containing protein [Thermoplasma volcanium]|nr:SCP2 sterol-binding domain-containing protein [Thermoplasma volcanium]
MGSKELINEMVSKVNEKDLSGIANAEKIVSIALSDAKPFTIIIKNGKIQLTDETPEKADATVKCSDQTLSDIITGKLNAFSAFMSGKVTVSGDLFFVQKIISVIGKTR